MAPPGERPLRVAFVHPDLGLGGAERLIVDAAHGLANGHDATGARHRVTIYTSHYDRQRCFEETLDGSFDVRTHGSAFPRSFRLPGSRGPRAGPGAGHLLCAIVRGLILALALLRDIWAARLGNDTPFDVVVIDQLVAWAPVIRFLGRVPVFYYCHFPDFWLARPADEATGTGPSPRRALLAAAKGAYRGFFDAWETLATGLCSDVAVNSRFTQTVFRLSFPRSSAATPGDTDWPHVLYPPTRDLVGASDCGSATGSPLSRQLAALLPPETILPPRAAADLSVKASQSRPIILSINRFERKKDLALALRALAGYHKVAGRLDADRAGADPRRPVLILAGGYDSRVSENVQHLRELAAFATGPLGFRVSVYHHHRHHRQQQEQEQEQEQQQEQQHEDLLAAGSTDAAVEAYCVHGSPRALALGPHLARVDVLFVTNFDQSLREDLMARASALIYTPAFEHFGIVPLEAMARGLPVLARANGGPLESVPHGSAGLLVPTQSILRRLMHRGTSAAGEWAPPKAESLPAAWCQSHLAPEAMRPLPRALTDEVELAHRLPATLDMALRRAAELLVDDSHQSPARDLLHPALDWEAAAFDTLAFGLAIYSILWATEVPELGLVYLVDPGTEATLSRDLVDALGKGDFHQVGLGLRLMLGCAGAEHVAAAFGHRTFVAQLVRLLRGLVPAGAGAVAGAN
ncbi:hypothetical protein H696_03864 [Fonticula alba]|uniref:Alpha-1,3/1,6-mannosyltransferase ALG2 n=1 Tax=Fonticula alba TaxID=691883 RepID=A0A058Z5A7_FONAL|nr:hypothetical protein H696_03864 [Fonticula alba]KCV69435.1 hypothetical protein H696_03864 [Fonticula alba]|eukprot:XP_009496000.1 hypothetical protein H696_03864 [Fonticula alba]